MERSKGHVMFRSVYGKDCEIFSAPSGDLYFSSIDNYIAVDGYRVGGRVLGTPGWFEGFRDKLDLVFA